MTTRDILFLLAPGFEDNSRREYCPECAEAYGLLAYFPAIKDSVEIRYQPIARPRAEMVALLGDAHQNCPTLVLHETAPGSDHAAIREENGRRFIDNARDMGKYFADRYGAPFPRGS
ncbi:MAG: DUF3088 family protein [Pseudomonadota bacterium]